MTKNTKHNSSEAVASVEKAHIKRRKVLSGLTASAAATGIASSGQWVKPVIDGVILPAHAQTSACVMTASAALRFGNSSYNSDSGDTYIGSVDVTGNYNDGTHNLAAYLTGNSNNNYNAGLTSEFGVAFAAPITEPLDVTLDVVFDNIPTVNVNEDIWNTFGPDAALSQTVALSPGATAASFSQVGGYDEDDPAGARVTGTIKASGCPTRRISFVITENN